MLNRRSNREMFRILEIEQPGKREEYPYWLQYEESLEYSPEGLAFLLWTKGTKDFERHGSTFVFREEKDMLRAKKILAKEVKGLETGGI